MIVMLFIVPILGETKKQIIEELRQGSSHGYELAKKLDVSVTGIYQHLKDLSGEGLIEHRQEGRRKVYRLTRRGRDLIRVLGN